MYNLAITELIYTRFGQDIIDLSVKVKHMHLISSSEGFALYQKCLEIERAAKSAAEERRAAAATVDQEQGSPSGVSSAAAGGIMKATFDGKLSIMTRKDAKGKEKEKEKERERDSNLKEKTTMGAAARERDSAHAATTVTKKADEKQRAVLDDRMLLEERLNDFPVPSSAAPLSLDLLGGDTELDTTTTKKIIRCVRTHRSSARPVEGLHSPQLWSRGWRSLRLLICSRRKLELALHSIPDSIQTLLHLGKGACTFVPFVLSFALRFFVHPLTLGFLGAQWSIGSHDCGMKRKKPSGVTPSRRPTATTCKVHTRALIGASARLC